MTTTYQKKHKKIFENHHINTQNNSQANSSEHFHQKYQPIRRWVIIATLLLTGVVTILMPPAYADANLPTTTVPFSTSMTEGKNSDLNPPDAEGLNTDNAISEDTASANENASLIRGKVIELRGEEQSDNGGYMSSLQQIVLVEITQGPYKGEKVVAGFNRSLLIKDYKERPLKVGSKVLIHLDTDIYGRIETAYISSIQRDGYLIFLVAFFIVIMLVIGRLKGLQAIVSLVITVLAVLYILTPSILAGYDPILISVLMCIGIIVLSLLIISGFSKKTLAAAIGTAGGVLIAGAIALIVGRLMSLTGLYEEEARMLAFVPQNVAFNFKGLLFAGILIATMGATMDVGMAVASSMQEISEQSSGITKYELYRSGMNVGRDTMATMANTLILAYTGASLNLILLFKAYHAPLVNILNWESITTEILRALSGSIGLVIAIPITAFVASLLFDSSVKN